MELRIGGPVFQLSNAQLQLRCAKGKREDKVANLIRIGELPKRLEKRKKLQENHHWEILDRWSECRL